MTDARPTADFAAITDRQQATWSLGDFNALGIQNMPVAEALVAAVDPRPGQRVLDLACGSGNAALVAARRHCEVTGLDFVPALLERARQRATADGVTVQLVEADAQALPFADASFDVALSIFGIMFAPNQQRAADEMVRVVRPGGRIALASWVPDGRVAEFFRTVSEYAPPPPGVPPAMRWGTEEGLKELLGDRTTALSVKREVLTQYFRSAEHMVDSFAKFFGPVIRAFAALDEADRTRLRTELVTMFTKQNVAKDGTLMVQYEYLQTVLERR